MRGAALGLQLAAGELMLLKSPGKSNIKYNPGRKRSVILTGQLRTNWV